MSISKKWEDLKRYLQKNRDRIKRFLLGGVPGSIIHLVIFLVLTNYFEVETVKASMIGVLPNFVVNFIIYKYYSFRNLGLDEVHIQFIALFDLMLIYLSLDGTLMYFFKWFWSISENDDWLKFLAQITVKVILGPPSFWAHNKALPERKENSARCSSR